MIQYFTMSDQIKQLASTVLAVVLIAILSVTTSIGQRSYQDLTVIDASTTEMVRAINAVRAKGCRCGTKYHPSAGPIEWHDQLKRSTQEYSIEMHKYKRFGHNGIDGSVVGDRVDRAGYFWQLAGENIAEGYTSFDEVLVAWLESPSHCGLIMDDRMNHVAVSKFGKYWTLHMAKPMPPGTKRSNVRYK